MPEVLIEKIKSSISCLQKLKEMKFNSQMDDFMKNIHLFNSEKTIESLVEGAEKQLTNIKNKVDNMDKILKREDVVITIFGGVSVGKSYFMNVLLNDEIFRSSSEHTTSCFVTVKKGDDNCLMYRDKKVKYDNFSEMKDKIDELCKTDETLKNKDMLQIIIKETSSSILKNNVVIVDTPGADRNTKIHDIIKEQSQNSDIFIFMINGNITDVDKGFFDYQTETSIRPDIFILINKLDNSDDDDDDESATQDSKLRITKECSNFIRKQKGGNNQDFESQIYFISTREALGKRTNPQTSHFTPKQEQRYAEFLKFEDKLQEYIKNPMQNKKRRYNEELNVIIRKFKDNFNRWKNSSNAIYLRSDKYKGDVEKLKKELNTFINKNISDVLNINDVTDINRQLSKLNEDCEQKVTEFFQKLITNYHLDKENRNIGTESSVSMVPIVFGNVSRTENVYQCDENNAIILKGMKEELKIDVKFVGKKMYYQYERLLNEISKKVEEDKKNWEEYICELDKIVSDLI